MAGFSCSIVAASEIRIRLPGPTKVRFHSQMNPYESAFTPASPRFRELDRLRDFFKLNGTVGQSRFALRHGQLEVVDGEEGSENLRLPNCCKLVIGGIVPGPVVFTVSMSVCCSRFEI